MRRKGGIVAAAVLGVQHKCEIENFRFQLRIAAIRAQDAQNIFRCGQLRQRVMDKEALAIVVIIVGVIAVNGQQGEGGDQLQALAQDVVDADIVCIVVIGVKRQDAARQRIHHIGARRLQDDIAHKARRKRAVARKQLGKLIELLPIRQIAEQQEVNGFFKAKALFFQKSGYNILNIHAAVEELSFAGDRLPIHLDGGLNFRNLGKSR